MGAPVLVSANVDEESVLIRFSGTDSDTVSAALDELMTAEGYKIERGDAFEGVYGIGNDIARALLGAFVKRYRFEVSVSDEGDKTELRVKKAMSGWSGGVIGRQKMKSEFKRIGKLLEIRIARSGAAASGAK